MEPKKCGKDFVLISFFQVQEHNGKSWFWLSGEVTTPTNQNLNPFAFSRIGGVKSSPVVN